MGNRQDREQTTGVAKAAQTQPMVLESNGTLSVKRGQSILLWLLPQGQALSSEGPSPFPTSCLERDDLNLQITNYPLPSSLLNWHMHFCSVLELSPSSWNVLSLPSPQKLTANH